MQMFNALAQYGLRRRSKIAGFAIFVHSQSENRQARYRPSLFPASGAKAHQVRFSVDIFAQCP
jgi:hypothetical protein